MGGGGSQSVVQSSAPWSQQQNYDVLNFQNALQDYQGAQNGQNLQYYPGDTYSGLNDTQQFLNSNIANVDAGGSPITNSGINADTGLMSSSTTNNPGSALLSNFANGSYTTAGNPYITQEGSIVASQVLPQINSQFGAAGRMDSGLASAAQSQGLGNAIGNLDFNNYTTEQGMQEAAANQIGTNYTNDTGNQIKAAAIAPALDQSFQTDMGTAYGAATNTQNDAQNQLNAQIAAYNYNQSLPWTELGDYDQALGGNLGSSGVTTSPNSVNSTSAALSGITGGLSGLNSLNNLSTSNGLIGSLSSWLGGSGGAATTGGLLGGLSPEAIAAIGGTGSAATDLATVASTMAFGGI